MKQNIETILLKRYEEGSDLPGIEYQPQKKSLKAPFNQCDTDEISILPKLEKYKIDSSYQMLKKTFGNY